MGQDLLYKVKAIVTISDNETQLDLQIPRKTLVSYPLSDEYLPAESSASNQKIQLPYLSDWQQRFPEMWAEMNLPGLA